MYRLLASHVYPEGHTYSGPAVECYYSFYVSKDFHPDDVAVNVIEQSQVGAAEEAATMLTTRAWVDESGANNLYSVKFNAYRPAIIGGTKISAPVSVAWAWVLRIVLVAIIAFTTIYVVKTIREISYSPSGPAMWDALKWIAIGVAGLAGVYIISKFLPRKAKSAS